MIKFKLIEVPTDTISYNCGEHTSCINIQGDPVANRFFKVIEGGDSNYFLEERSKAMFKLYTIHSAEEDDEEAKTIGSWVNHFVGGV